MRGGLVLDHLQQKQQQLVQMRWEQPAFQETGRRVGVGEDQPEWPELEAATGRAAGGREQRIQPDATRRRWPPESAGLGGGDERASGWGWIWHRDDEGRGGRDARSAAATAAAAVGGRRDETRWGMEE